MDFNFAIEATGGGVRGAPALPSRQPVWARGVVGRVILNAPLYGLLLALMMCAGVANAADYPSSCFTQMGNDRVLLMNNDSNAQCPITLQSYYDTNTTQSTYWTHDGAPAVTEHVSVGGDYMDRYNMKDGTHHILWQRIDNYTNLGGETGVSSNKLWELVNCRAGSVAINNTLSSTTRNYIPWTTTSLSIDTGEAMPSTTYNNTAAAGVVIMQNTTDACIISPFYTNGVGAIYFDAINGWCNRAGELVLEIATETADGTYFSERSTNLNWQVQKVDVLEVVNSSFGCSVSVRTNDVNSIVLDQTNTGSSYIMSRRFYRIRADVSCRKPIRFRIRRATAVAAVSQLDSPTYMLVDNIMASYPPLGLEFDIPGKQLDETREKKRVLGWEGTLDCCFAFTGQSGACPMAEIPLSVYTPFGVFGPDDFGIKDIKFNYRWTYLGIDSSGWQTLDMQRTDKTKIRAADPSSGLSLTNETGDIEFYYTMQVTNAPHFWPTDFALGTKISTKNAAGYKTPYGSDWEEGGGEWTCTSRRDASEGKLPSGGTDWFFRLRDGYTVYEDVAVVAHYKSGEETVTSNIWMELVGEHSWRAYVYMPTNMAGKTMAFSFAGYNRQYVSTTGFDVNTNEWKLTTEKIASLPYSGVADGSEIATVPFDLDSTHLLFEFNDETGAFAISHAAFQDFNKWTDAANGYMGYYSTTAAVSEAKQTFAEDFSTWQTSDGYNSLWHEDFNVTGVISNNSPYYPGKPFGANWPTPHGWIANNGMFVCEAYTNTEDGLALELEGCGRGTVELKNLAAGDVPQGLGSVDFTARIAQPYSMDNFAYSLAAYRETNYAFSVKTTLSTRQGSDMSLTDPTVSLVAYYRPGMGCYEARAKRVSATMVELSLWKWGWQGNTLTCKQIGKSAYMGRPVPTNSGILDTTHALVNETATDSNRYQLWHTMSISAYNTSGGTVVQARLARYQSGYSIVYDHPSTDQSGRYSDQRYIIVTATDSEANRLTSGAYGMGSVNCAGYFGNPRFHQPMSNSTNFLYAGTELSANDLEYDWSIPSRYRQLSTNANRNEYGLNETAAFSWRPNTSVTAEQRNNGWLCGLAAKVPEQSVAIRYQLLGSSEWIDIGNVTVTNFLSTYYTFSPRVTEDCYVQLAAGGDRYDTCVDVAVDDIDINSWRGRSTDISKNYGEKDDWVYTSCWVESALGFTGAATSTTLLG